MRAKKKLQIKEAFQLAQKPHQNRAKLVLALKSTYDQVRLLSGRGPVAMRTERGRSAVGPAFASKGLFGPV